MKLKTLKRYVYLFALTDGFILWYAIDKIYYLEYGVTLQQIVVLAIMAWLPQIIFEVPSSVLADRWSRKGVLIIGTVALSLSTLVLGVGSVFWVFLVGIALWSFAISMMSGTFEALLYDSLKAQKQEKHYQAIHGHSVTLGQISCMFAGLLALPAVHYLGLKSVFYLSLPFILSGVIFILKIPEPAITRTSHQNLSWYRHMLDAVQIIRGQALRWLALLFVGFVAFRSVMYEFYQLIGAEKTMTTEQITLFFSAILGSMALAAYIFGKLTLTKRKIQAMWLLFFSSGIAGLYADSPLVAAGFLLILFGCMQFVELYVQLGIQHRVDSSKRATILSTASAVGQVMFLFLAGAISMMIESYGPTIAVAVVSVPIAVLGLVEVLKHPGRSLEAT